ncbi:hypothetical protein JNM05_08525 [bacterium]|nr:hypothetical protein [bacterium]
MAHIRRFCTCVLLFIMMFPLADSINAQTDRTAEYINQTFYNKRLSLIRTGYDRWKGLADAFPQEKHISEMNAHFYAAVNDFNYGKDADGKTIMPMMVGYAFGWPIGGFYFLGYTTDFKNFFKKDKDESAGYYKAFTLGANVDLRLITLQGDATVSGGTVSLYGKSYIAPVRSFVGAGISKFGLVDRVLPGSSAQPLDAATLAKSQANAAAVNAQQIINKGTYALDLIEFGTNYFPYFTTGLKYFKLVKARYVPNISTAYHQFVDYKDWEKMSWDFELFYESRGKTLTKSFSPKDYEIRFSVFKFLGDQSDALSTDIGTKGTTWRPAAFLGLSYKSKEDAISQTLTESGQAYTGEHGFGGEIGAGFRVLGFKRFGFQEDTYVKLSYFINYSQYFERLPAMTSGLKFRVVF